MKQGSCALLLFFLLSLAVLLAPLGATAAGTSPKNVLLLTSYHQGDRWNDSVVEGVREALGALESVSLSIENLDMRRHTDQDYIRLTTHYLRAKYQGSSPDLVLVSDDPALNFLLTVRDDLFSTAPVVFCGVNNFNPKRLHEHTNITGVNEALTLEATLELALSLFPRTTRIMAIVSDSEVSARTNLEHYRAMAARMRGRVTFEELLNMTDRDAPEILRRLPKDSLILRLTTLLKPEGGFLSIEEGSRIFSTFAPVPVFTGWSFDIGDCALGGYVISGRDQGHAAGKLAIRILEGQSADQIPVVMESPNVAMFDYNVMERFGIKESALPQGSVVLNRQVSMWEHYWVWLLGIALFCGLQTFLIVALLTRGKRLHAANSALRESEERYRSVVENISDIYFRIDLEGRVIMCSPSAMRLLGYGSLDEILGRPAASFYDDPIALEHLLERLRLEGSVNDYEITLRRRDGSIVQVATTSSYYRDAAGTVLGVEGLLRDITARKRAEEELRASREILKAVLDAIPVRVFWKDRDLRYLGCNASFARDAGFEKPEDLIGKDDYAMGWREQAELYRADDRAVIDSGIPRHLIEEPQTTPSGGTIHLLTSKVPLHDADGNTGGVLGAYVDITDRKRAEEEKKLLNTQLQQAQKLEAIGTLAGGIAHDFNNILGAIIGYAEMIRDDFPPDSSGIHNINEVLKAGFRARDLVKQILTFSRQAEGQRTLIDPAVVVREAIGLLRSSLPATITIEQDIEPDLGMILADPTQIHQIVMNLATNAFHAMEIKGGVLTVSLRKKALSQDDLATLPDLQPGSFVQLTIRDTGEGIPVEIRERIFDPFFTTKEVGKGTGLGLSTVYSIVRSCRGAIACDSRVGEGSEFRILLPRTEGQVERENGAADQITHGKEHILFVDDEEMLVKMGEALLGRLGYRVTTRRNGYDALATFQHQPEAFDLIITDQTMSGMTGVELARRILEIRPNMPIILCTGYSSQISEDIAKAAGIKGFALKPLAKKDIGDLIRKVLDGNHQ